MQGISSKSAPIGMFDSGVGGISVLREAVRQLPREHFIFFGDTLNAPYGTKPREQVLALSRQVVEKLLERGVKALVIACNTATSAAAAELRQAYDFPIIGMEPALKPASLLHRDGVVLSLATPGTIAGQKYAQLMAQYGEGVISLPCPGLMEFVERGEMEGQRLMDYFAALFQPYKEAKVEAIVLGCTHYVFLKRTISAFFPEAALVDGNAGTVRQLIRRLKEEDGLADGEGAGKVELLSSGGDEAVQVMRRLLAM